MDNETKPASVSLSVIQFVDRALEQERRLTDSEFKRLDEALIAHKEKDDFRHNVENESILKSEQDISRRLEEMNQFRDQINKERGDYLLASMYDREHEELIRRVEALEISKGGYRGSYIASGVVLIIVGQMIGFILLYMQVKR